MYREFSIFFARHVLSPLGSKFGLCGCLYDIRMLEKVSKWVRRLQYHFDLEWREHCESMDVGKVAVMCKPHPVIVTSMCPFSDHVEGVSLLDGSMQSASIEHCAPYPVDAETTWKMIEAYREHGIDGAYAVENDMSIEEYREQDRREPEHYE